MAGTVTSNHKYSASEDKLNDAQRNLSRDSTHYKSNVSGLPHLLSSIYTNYRDKTLSLTKNKRFSISNTKSVFKFKETDKIIGSIKHSTHNIELINLKTKTKRLQNDISAVNVKNSDLVKKLNLIKFISKTRPTNVLAPQANNYFKECEQFTHKYQDKKQRLKNKLHDLGARLADKQTQNEALEQSIKQKKQAYVHLRAKRDAYASLKRRAHACDEKSRAIKKRLNADKEVVFAAHELTVQNEKLQLDKLQYEIAQFIISDMNSSSKTHVRRLIFEAKELEMKARSGV